MTTAETTRKPLAAELNNFRVHTPMSLEADKKLLEIIKSLESSSESLTGLKEAVEARKKNIDDTKWGWKMREEEDDWFLKLIEEREQASK